MEPHFWEFIEEVVTQLRKDAGSTCGVQLDVGAEASAIREPSK